MFLGSLLLAGAFTLAAQAFVVPETNNIPEAEIVAPPLSLNLDCSTCPYALKSQRNGRHEWTAGVASDLELKLDSTRENILFNDVQIFPLQNPTRPPTLYVSQKKKEGEVSDMEGFEGQLRLSYSMEYNEKKVENGTLVSMVMTFMGIDGQMIKVDNLEINVFKQDDGHLISYKYTAVPPSPNGPDAKCGTILCRVFTKIITGAHKAKASAKGAAQKMKGVCVKCLHKITGHAHHQGGKGEMGKHGIPHSRPDGTMVLPTHIHLNPVPGRPVHGHHHHHNGFLGRMAMVLNTTVKVVFVPILVGVAFGMAASAIGMLVGQAVVYLWMKFRRAPGATYERVETDDKDAPPAYQDVQGAEAISEKEVEDKA